MFLLCVICVHKYCEFLSSFVRHRRCSDGGALSVGEMEWCGTAPGRASTRVASRSWLLPRPYLRRGTGLHSRTFPFSLLDQGTSPDNSCANHTSFPKFWNWAHIVVAVLWSPVKVGAKAGIWVGTAHLGALYAEEQRETIERNKCGARRDKRASQRERDKEIQIILIDSFQLWDWNASPLLGKGELSLEPCIASFPLPSLLPSNCTQCPGHMKAENSILLGQIGVERSFIESNSPISWNWRPRPGLRWSDAPVVTQLMNAELGL